MSDTLQDAIRQAIKDNEVILFMKGVPEAPACGFSARAVGALQAVGASFAAVDVLPDPRIRQELSAISGWPTIPQLFAKGDLIGGSDIIMEMYEAGELAPALGLEQPADAPEEPEAPASADGEAPPLQIENRLG